jgi:hypothetical protein
MNPVIVLATIAVFGAFYATLRLLTGFVLERARIQAGQDAWPADRQRLERVEHAVEAIAVEVERISEGQRFTTRLLVDRQAASRVAADPRAPRGGSTTPH